MLVIERMRNHIVSMLAVAMLLPGLSLAVEESLVDQLRSEYAALITADSHYRIQREQGALNGAEASDYAAYIARLHRRVAVDCLAVMEASIDLPDDVVCPSLPVLPEPADINLGAEQTLSEKTGVLDAELMAGLGDFDEMLLREQERVKATAPRTDAGGGSGAGGGGGSGGGGSSGSGAAGGAGDEGDELSASGSATAQQTGGGSGSGATRKGGAATPGSWNQPATSGSAPDDIPDGSDDDIVARQLREAAEKETDPELKKKLWEEYRRYKQGTR